MGFGHDKCADRSPEHHCTNIHRRRFRGCHGPDVHRHRIRGRHGAATGAAQSGLQPTDGHCRAQVNRRLRVRDHARDIERQPVQSHGQHNVLLLCRGAPRAALCVVPRRVLHARRRVCGVRPLEGRLPRGFHSLRHGHRAGLARRRLGPRHHPSRRARASAHERRVARQGRPAGRRRRRAPEGPR
eukprot:Amastigsp_a175498_54.p3 type:complete len:185 gc:universal Amastigsp_a175498_54:1-555(+)